MEKVAALYGIPFSPLILHICVRTYASVWYVRTQAYAYMPGGTPIHVRIYTCVYTRMRRGKEQGEAIYR